MGEGERPWAPRCVSSTRRQSGLIARAARGCIDVQMNAAARRGAAQSAVFWLALHKQLDLHSALQLAAARERTQASRNAPGIKTERHKALLPLPP